ncbi:MAG: 16S rRNA (cytosine(1402)-N(4))-methyltransferase RsmH [bacterium]
MSHIPVLAEEVLEYADPKPNQYFVDATLGNGGHALAILEKTKPHGRLLGIDLDKKTVDEFAERIKNTEFEKRVILACGNFSDLKSIIAKNNFGPVGGIIADLGLSSMEIETRGRGFSFLKNEPLIMAYGEWNAENSLTATKIVNGWDEKQLAEILWSYGEERFSRQIAKKIACYRKARPIETTFQLVEIIKKSTPVWYHHGRLHPATKTFQALRIVVNDELENLKSFLPQALDLIEKNGRLVIISFHSLEDRIVKKYFKESKKEGLIKILTKKVIMPGRAEIAENPRSRSAKLRAGEKL